MPHQMSGLDLRFQLLSRGNALVTDSQPGPLRRGTSLGNRRNQIGYGRVETLLDHGQRLEQAIARRPELLYLSATGLTFARQVIEHPLPHNLRLRHHVTAVGATILRERLGVALGPLDNFVSFRRCSGAS